MQKSPINLLHTANHNYWGFPGGASGKEPACQCKRQKRHGFDPWVRKFPWRRAWQPTPVLLPGESMDRGAWWATVHGVAKNQTQLSDLAHTHAITNASLFPHRGFPGGLVVKNLPAVPETWVRSLGWEDLLEKENGNPLQYSCLENPMDRGAWQATVHRVAKGQT